MDWPPLEPADAAIQKPRVDPTADAECLLWDVRVENKIMNNQDGVTTYTHLVRIKIFTDGGVKKFGQVDLPYGDKSKIGDVSGRTIEPDGSIIELKKDAVFDHVLEKLHRRKTQAVSFAMPGVKPGAIIEYRYKQIYDQVARYDILQAQMEDIPVEHLVFHIKPIESPYIALTMRYRPFLTTLPPFKDSPDHYSVSSIDNIPAFRSEPDAPPDSSVRAWVLLYYTEDTKEVPDKFWKREGKRIYDEYSNEIKVNGAVKQIAEEQTSGAKSDDEKLNKLYYYCQKHIKNVYGKEVSDADRQSFKPNKNTADTLQRGEGSGYDITLAFIALAQAAGYEARLAQLMDRETMIFHKELMLPFFDVTDAAVNVGGTWRLYDPETRWLGPGELRWQEQVVEALIPDPKDPEFVQVPVTPADKSVRKQVARLKLDEEGSIDGALEETLTGQLAAEWRFENIDHSDGDRKKGFEDKVKAHLAGAEVTDVKVSDPTDTSIPVTLSCRVKVEAFATKTGKRLFFTPAVFQMNEPARYPESKRTFDVLYQYPWTEREAVSITFPEGFAKDNADLPQPINFDPIGHYVTKAVVLNNRLVYEREFVFGNNGTIYFLTKAYPTIKKIFDGLHDNDAHMLTLKQEPAVAQSQ